MLAGTMTTLRGAEKVKHAVRQWIETNKPRQHDKFLSQRELAKLLKVDPMTAHKALNELTGEGILYRIKGKGSFIGLDPALNQGLRLAFVVPGSHLELPENNPDNWHIVQRTSASVMRTLQDNDSFSTIIIKPGQSNANDITRLSKYNAVIFSGYNEFIQLIEKLIAHNTTVIINGSNSQCPFGCIKLSPPLAEDVKIGISYLIERGYNRIAYIGSSSIEGDVKFSGYRQALDEYGIEFDEQLAVRGISHQSEGAKGAALLVNRQVKFDAIFADTDLKAVGIIEYLLQTGLKIPEAIGVMGFDGMEQCTGAPLYLTSVKPANDKIIKNAVDFIREKSQQSFDDIPIPHGQVIKNRTTK
ncbi:MAG: GntR family transcriptional regulator [Victivallaceae bacterium]|nr:GntR family transcriptional regulator [Victivallaceae bacterium]